MYDDDTVDLAERIERDRQRAAMQELLDKGHHEALEAAKDRPPPAAVEAYRGVFGEFPRGWPPWD